MPTLHVVVSKDLKQWLKARAKREEVHGSTSRYCARVLMDHRTITEKSERNAPTTEKGEN